MCFSNGTCRGKVKTKKAEKETAERGKITPKWEGLKLCIQKMNLLEYLSSFKKPNVPRYLQPYDRDSVLNTSNRGCHPHPKFSNTHTHSSFF